MTELRKTQGYVSTNSKTSARQTQELERSVQSSLGKVESNAPMFVGYFDDTAFLPTGTKIKLHRFKELKAERITVNGKDPDGDALLFKSPGYYLLNISTSCRMQTNVSACTVRAVVDGKTVGGAFVRGVNNNSTNVPLLGSSIVRVPQGKPMTFVVNTTTVSGSGNQDTRFSTHTSPQFPNFSLMWVRPLEGS